MDFVAEALDMNPLNFIQYPVNLALPNDGSIIGHFGDPGTSFKVNPSFDDIYSFISKILNKINNGKQYFVRFINKILDYFLITAPKHTPEFLNASQHTF